MEQIFSCFVDSRPKFIIQARVWIESLLDGQVAKNSELFLHLKHGVDNGFIEFVESKGIRYKFVESFGEGEAVYCNKLQQLLTEEFQNADLIFLCDTDLFFLTDFKTEIEGVSDIGAKVVDMPCPPLSILLELGKKAGFPQPELVDVDFAPGEQTFFANCNGGLYVFRQEAFQKIREPWIRWAKWCLEQKNILGDYLKHADQIGFCFAVMETGLELTHLPSSLNFPTHFSKEIYKKAAKKEIPKVLHYHSEVDNNLFLKQTGVGFIDEAINKANAEISKMQRSDFSNQLFWSYRYEENPDLGSGVGSRGETLEYKKRLLAPYQHFFRSKMVLDVGCGDLELTRDAVFEDYTGIDISPSAIKICQRKRPDWAFFSKPIDQVEGQFDLVSCFDVLIHQSSREDYLALVKNMVEKADEALIIGAYESQPSYSSSITFFYEPISETIKRLPGIKGIEKIGDYRDITVFLVEKKSERPINTSDIPLSHLVRVFSEVPYSKRLLELVDLSREKLGFFPKTTIRAWEYPWVVEKAHIYFENFEGLNILDVGAGVNVLPFWFSKAGANMVTVDPHPLERKLENKESWNEWGFLDYGQMSDGRISSYCEDASKIELKEKQDLIYSVSVIEHLPGKIRRGILNNAYQLMAPGGVLLLTVDLVPGANRLWNLSEGRKVELKWLHGTFGTLIREINKAGFSIVSKEIQRDIFESRTDVGYLVARK